VKKIIEDDDESLVSLLGEEVTLFCSNYFYTGKLIAVGDSCVKLEDAGIIYETGDFDDSKWKDLQKFNTKVHYVQICSIESFGVFDKG